MGAIMSIAGWVVAACFAVFYSLGSKVPESFSELNGVRVNQFRYGKELAVIFVDNAENQYKLRVSRDDWTFLTCGLVVDIEYDENFFVKKIKYSKQG
jgi:hypothetical protein